MREYFKDYGNLCKESGEFYKKHWLGTIILTIVSTLLTWLTLGGYGIIKDKINEYKTNKKNEKIVLHNKRS